MVALLKTLERIGPQVQTRFYWLEEYWWRREVDEITLSQKDLADYEGPNPVVVRQSVFHKLRLLLRSMDGMESGHELAIREMFRQMLGDDDAQKELLEIFGASSSTCGYASMISSLGIPLWIVSVE